jgi:hypothetical protein
LSGPTGDVTRRVPERFRGLRPGLRIFYGWLVADGGRVVERLFELVHLEPGGAQRGGRHVKRAMPRFASLSGMAH